MLPGHTIPLFKTYASQRPNDLTIRFTSTQTTCLTAPEVTEGPYYVNNELVRENITESQQ